MNPSFQLNLDKIKEKERESKEKIADAGNSVYIII